MHKIFICFGYTLRVDIKEYFKDRAIQYTVFAHAPVFTVEEAKRERLHEKIRGVQCKNLFLKERKSRRFYLLVAPEHKKVDLKLFGESIGDSIKFANEQDLKEYLGVTPGAVSPFGLINDRDHKVQLIIDKEVWDAQFVSFHPNINTETLELSGIDFHKYVESLSNELKIIEV